MAKVLIVEDNPDHIELAHRALDSEYEVLAAPNARMGLQMATEHHPDVILLDLDLPDMCGQALLEQMRCVSELADVPIIAVTAWPPGTDPRTTKACGFDDSISKPISFSTFASQIAAYLPQNRASV